MHVSCFLIVLGPLLYTFEVPAMHLDLSETKNGRAMPFQKWQGWAKNRSFSIFSAFHHVHLSKYARDLPVDQHGCCCVYILNRCKALLLLLPDIRSCIQAKNKLLQIRPSDSLPRFKPQRQRQKVETSEAYCTSRIFRPPFLRITCCVAFNLHRSALSAIHPISIKDWARC